MGRRRDSLWVVMTNDPTPMYVTKGYRFTVMYRGAHKMHTREAADAFLAKVEGQTTNGTTYQVYVC